MKKKLFRIAKNVGITLSFAWTTYNYWNVNALYIESQAKIDAVTEKYDALRTSSSSKDRVISFLVAQTAQKSANIDRIETPAWFKILRKDTFIVKSVNLAYQKFMPEGVDRLELFGRTGHYLEYEFGEVYQKNDHDAARSERPKVYIEPYREGGVLKKGKFLKGRVWENKSEIEIFGFFIEEVQ